MSKTFKPETAITVSKSESAMPATGDCLQTLATLASGLAAKVADEVSGTQLMQKQGSEDGGDYQTACNADVAECRSAPISWHL